MLELEKYKVSSYEELVELANKKKQEIKEANKGKKIDENKSRWPFADDYFDCVWSKDDESNN